MAQQVSHFEIRSEPAIGIEANSEPASESVAGALQLNRNRDLGLNLVNLNTPG